MTVKIRALVAALIVVVVAAAGAIFLGYRAGASASSIDLAATGEVSELFGGGGSGGPALLSDALARLEKNYYKPVDPKTVYTGEVDGLREYLQAKKVKDVRLPALTPSDDAAKESAQLASVLTYAQDHYAGKIGADGKTDLTEAALRGLMGSVDDPYTVYLSPREIQGLNESLNGGDFGGIGVYIYQLKDGRVVVQPIQEMPAAKAGMKPGEVVDTVDGKPIKGMTLDRVEQLIRGAAGSTVRLTTHAYNKPSAERSYAIVREIIHVPTVRAKMENGYDYIRLSDFGETSADEVRKALLDGQAHHAKGYILDLRDNGGGYLEAAVEISSFFIPQGTIVSTIDRAGEKRVEEANGTAIPGLSPLVVLVNKYTASASEITSGALQDYHLATLIGTKTFGKGVVQSIYPLPDHGALKITTARYVTPLGRDIQHKGIEPDVVVPQDPDPALIDTPADKQLAAAKARLSALNR
ncbi:MAG TPA: S41 family peptidase [Verrucomicrobiae bacterium]|nr:S41 family peptidase [Verrucomicrobiae bacterium]